MKIVHTFWSRNITDINELLQHKAGWLTSEHHYMSWTLSCLLARKWYDEVELITDPLGKELLVDKMQLPYTNVRVIIDDKMDEFHEDFWALSKVVAYSLQDKPFLHIDGDVFLFKKLNDNLQSKGLIAQNVERNFKLYEESIQSVMDKFSYIPSYISDDFHQNTGWSASNAGILGGNDIDFIQTYCQEVFNFVRQNKNNWKDIMPLHMNCFSEQYLFFTLAAVHDKTIHYYFDEVTTFEKDYPKLGKITPESVENGYIHLLGYFKYFKCNYDYMINTLKSDYTKNYEIVKQLFIDPNAPFISENTEYYLSCYQQQQEWLLQKIKTTPQAFNMQLQVETPFFNKNVNDFLLTKLIERHEVLRSSYEMKDGQLFQKVLPPNEVQVEIVYKDLIACTHREDALKKIINSETEILFDLEKFPLYKVLWVKMTETRNVVLFTTHHAIADFNSFELLKGDMQNLVNFMNARSAISLKPVIAQFSDYASFQNKMLSKERMKKYWMNKLQNGIPALEIINPERQIQAKIKHKVFQETVYASFKPEEHLYEYCLEEVSNRYQRHAGAEISYTLTPENSDLLKQFCQKNQFAPSNILMATLGLMCYQQAQQTRLAIDIPSINRPKKAFDNTMGWLTVGGICLIDVDLNVSLSDFFNNINTEVLEVYQNSAFPLGTLSMESPKLPIEKWAAPILFNHFMLTNANIEVENAGIFTHKSDNLTANFDLSFNFYQYANSMQMFCKYRTDLFDSNEIEQHFKVFFDLLTNITQCDINTKLIDFLHPLSSLSRSVFIKGNSYKQCA